MKCFGLLGTIVIFFGLAGLGTAHDCDHHGHHYYQDGCSNCGHGCAGAGCQSAAASSGRFTERSLQGKVTEVIYLPGDTAENGMVDVRIVSNGLTTLVRLAPSGYLKQSGIRLKEGETITVRGYPVAALDGDLTVATDLQEGDKTVRLRDERGRSAW